MVKEKEEKISEEETPTYEYYPRRHHGGGYIGALILIFIGLIFLLNNLNILPWDMWNQLVKFWPVIIIMVGVEMLFGKSPLIKIILGFLTLFILAGILAYFLSFYGLFPLFPRF